LRSFAAKNLETVENDREEFSVASRGVIAFDLIANDCETLLRV
jgi:hypothetical protein